MISLKWDITSKCNLRCRHCYNYMGNLDSDIDRDRDLTTEEIYDTLERFSGRLKLIQFLGGEPLCHPDFLDILERLDRMGVAVQFNTNAHLLTPELADRITRLNVREIIVALDGPEPETTS